MDNNYSLADIRAVTEGSGGGNGGNYSGGLGGDLLSIVVLFVLLAMFGGLGGGFGFGGLGGGGAANGILTRAELQQGFDTQEITRKLDGLTNGLSDGFYATNNTLVNGFASINAAVCDAKFASQQCCCDLGRAIDGVKFENAQNTCAITTAIHAEGEATRAAIAAQETNWLRDQLAQERCINSSNAQSQYILGQIGKYYTNPPCYGNCNPCGGNYGNYGGFGSGFGYGLSLGLGYGGNNCGCGCNNI